MHRNLKALGLALVAVFAMSAVAASAASAKYDTFRTQNGETVTPTVSSISASQRFKIEGAEEESNCKEISATGSLLDKTTDVTVAPTYSNCTATRNGSTVAATVETTGCEYTFTGETNASEHAEVHILCETGKSIHIKVTALKLQCFTIPPQTVGGIHYINTGTTPNRDIDIKATATGIKTEKGGACGEGEAKAEYTGEVTVKGHNKNAEPREIWFETRNTLEMP